MIRPPTGSTRDPSTRFVLGTTPKADESLASFIVRAAARQGTTVSRLTGRSGNFVLSGIGEAPALLRIAGLTDVPVENLQAISYGPHNKKRMRFRGSTTSEAFLRRYRERRRVCPDCLSESLHHRAVWDLTFFSACPSHRRAMVSSCPACRRPLTWNCENLAGCVCRGCDLRSVPPKGELPHLDILNAIAAASGLLGDERYREQADALHRLMPVCELDAPDALEFVCRFGMDLSYGSSNNFGVTKFGRDTLDHAAIISRGTRAIETWPELFLDPRHEPGCGEGSTRNATMHLASSRMLWQTGVEHWLAEVPPERGKSIRDFVRDHPVFDAYAEKMSPPTAPA